ncbi:uncharacterized protein LOC108882478 isoform X1 [Lates calcarifer]|uniref:Uncharacterized protein LOC108882478 isoform X1 n=1 Tax=Lates calcarifer TaxID=8187 RepID=A0AAJ8B5E5_LATCA|nr:uncharacterized protein LOC108882478 isoform X1 [Lates calcarifer]
MRNPVTVLTTLLSVEFVLYTMSLCSPQWLVLTAGASEGLFALCSAYQGFSSCTTFPAWLGSYSLSWMFLSASCLLSLAALLTVRPALIRGRKAVAALLLNISSSKTHSEHTITQQINTLTRPHSVSVQLSEVALCAGSLISFLVSIEQQDPELLHRLGWTFYICCATLLYASLVTVLLGVIHGDGGRVEPAVRAGAAAVDLSVIAA